jgi:hypothetical protein
MSLNRAHYRARGRLLAGLTAVVVGAVGAAVPAHAADPAGVVTSSAVAEPSTSATPQDKFAAAAVLGINPDTDMMVLNDQDFVLSLWRQAKPDSHVKAAALRAYEDADPQAAYEFIKTGIFAAAADDAQVEIAAERAKALRRSVAVTVGLDPRDTALIEQSDRDFIFAVWQRVAAGSHVKAAAQEAIKEGSTAADWTQFLTVGAQAAHNQDVRDEIDRADAEQAAVLAAQQLATAKRSLLQMLLLPVTEELVSAPNRQFVLHVKNNAKGTEVQLAAQAALNAPDATLDKALSDFIFTGGAAANALDEKAAAAKELADYRAKVVVIRDAARKDGFLPTLTAAADQALTANTVLALQTFLLKGQDTARNADKRSWATVVLAGDRIGVLNTSTTAQAKDGGLSALWSTQRAGVKQLALSGERVGVLTTDGTAYVREGALNATTWVNVRTGVKQLVLAGDRIGVLSTDGVAYVKDGGLSAGWVTVRTGVKQLALSGERVGVLTTDGTAYVKEGGLSAGWVTALTGAKQLVLAGDRIGVVNTAGTAYVKDGGLSAGWVNQRAGVTDLVLAGDRVGVLTTDGTAFVREGALTATWVTEHSSVRRLALDGKRIGVLRSDGVVWVKEGGLSAAWVNELNVGPLS